MFQLRKGNCGFVEYSELEGNLRARWVQPLDPYRPPITPTLHWRCVQMLLELQQIGAVPTVLVPCPPPTAPEHFPFIQPEMYMAWHVVLPMCPVRMCHRCLVVSGCISCSSHLSSSSRCYCAFWPSWRLSFQGPLFPTKDLLKGCHWFCVHKLVLSPKVVCPLGFLTCEGTLSAPKPPSVML